MAQARCAGMLHAWRRGGTAVVHGAVQGWVQRWFRADKEAAYTVVLKVSVVGDLGERIASRSAGMRGVAGSNKGGVTSCSSIFMKCFGSSDCAGLCNSTDSHCCTTVSFDEARARPSTVPPSW